MSRQAGRWGYECLDRSDSPLPDCLLRWRAMSPETKHGCVVSILLVLAVPSAAIAFAVTCGAVSGIVQNNVRDRWLEQLFGYGLAFLSGAIAALTVGSVAGFFYWLYVRRTR